MSAVGQEVVDFLLPKLDDPLQVGFLVIILSMMLYTIVSTHIAAREKSWEKKWNRGTATEDDDLDIEHGSVTDLWHAVATSSEKLADIMPGMLLVVGLLGTFLGLGMALNHASSILGEANAIADSMGDLLGLLKGLGTKFKTSTWGIMGFVLLKIWSEVFRFDERRLTWVIAKVKDALKSRNEQRQAAEEAKQQVLLGQIMAAASAIVEGVTGAIAAATASNTTALEAGFGGVLVAVQDAQSQAASEARSRASGAARAVKQTAAALEAGFAAVRQGLSDVHSETRCTSAAMSDFTGSTTAIVRQMGVAADGMAVGADKISVAAVGLNKVIDEFGVKFTGVLDDVGEKLHSTISEMSVQSAATLREGSAKLEGATKQISSALEMLSDDVKATMNQVQFSITDALNIQRRSSAALTDSMTTFNNHIETTTIRTATLVDSIKSGLSAISTANQQMRKVANSLEAQLPVLTMIAARISVPDETAGVGDDRAPTDDVDESVGALESVT